MIIKNLKINSDKIYLKHLKSQNATEEYCNWLNDAEVNKYLETRKANIKDLKNYIKAKNKRKDILFLGIFYKKNGEHIGNIKLEPVDLKNKKATLGLLIGNKNYWGKGIGTEATKLLINYAFDYLNINEINLGVIIENKAAIKVYKKTGFKIVKVEKKAIKHDNKRYDKIIMSIKNMAKKFNKSQELFIKVSKNIPLASQTFSKSYLQYIKGQAPLFITHAKGSKVWDVDGNEYVDFINGLLPVILGYQYPVVDEAISNQLKKGIIFSLPSPLENELAELLIKHIPCAEMVRFGKNGSDVTTGAIRLARAVTGRDHVAACGYHGWHDWYIGSTTKNLGVPESTQKLTHKFIYNDIKSLEKIFADNKNKVAAVIMEPMNYVEPEKGFLKKVKKLAHKNGALLIFDEVITGFRYSLGGAQKLFGVIPDLASFGKSMANGMPISALVGKRKYMKKVGDIFYSFTNGGEALSLVAAIATIKEMEKKKVINDIWKKGEYLIKETNKLIKKNNLEEVIKIKGKPCWSLMFTYECNGYTDLEIKSYLQQEILQAGFLWYGQHNISFSHSRKDIDALLKAYDKVFSRLKDLLVRKKLKENLKGELITNIFKVR